MRKKIEAYVSSADGLVIPQSIQVTTGLCLFDGVHPKNLAGLNLFPTRHMLIYRFRGLFQKRNVQHADALFRDFDAVQHTGAFGFR
jgi:hypothetical protein